MQTAVTKPCLTFAATSLNRSGVTGDVVVAYPWDYQSKIGYCLMLHLLTSLAVQTHVMKLLLQGVLLSAQRQPWPSVGILSR